MGKILVLAEKPSVGRELARVLGCKKNGDGCLMGEKYIVTWALGHLIELAEPEHYGDQYKTWRMDTLPMLPKKMDLKVIPSTSKQYHAVKKLLTSKEVDSLVIATDAGREGELVARWILEKAGFRKPVKRLWISSQTDKAIKEGFAHLKDGAEYENLYASAQGRAEADWLVGLNVTRALTCKFNAQLSAGRVQTPTLALIVRREEEIKKFVPKPYYNVKADLGDLIVTYHDGKKQTAIYDEEKAKALAEGLKGKTFTVDQVTTTQKRTPPPMLYDLTELQRDANKIYGYSPKQTLNYMQRLYENHKALTYPRTDSRYLPADVVPTLSDRLRAVSQGEFAPLVGEIIKNKSAIAKGCVNDAKVSDHHAIIPTEQKADMVKMSTEEKRIFMLVVRRFLACFYPEAVHENIRAELSCGEHQFSAAGKRMVSLGWCKVENPQEEEEEEIQNLPPLEKGQQRVCRQVLCKTLKTSPPSRYTEASLLSAMENPAKFIEEKEMKEYIGGGLGTPATRADIIEKLFSSFYLEKKGNVIVPTSKAVQLISLVPNDLKEPLLTAKWEQQLEAISKGKEKKDTFIRQIRGYTTDLVGQVKESQGEYVHDNLTKNICPQCGKYLLSIQGKKGKMLVCQDRECGYRENVSMQTNMRCPNCHKKMELWGSGEKKTYVCSCGYRERAEKLHEKKGNTASKGYVKQYMRQQKEEAQGKSALALALEKALGEKS